MHFTSHRVKVLVVDDSALVRQVLSDILSSDPEIEVVGTAADPFAAAEKMRQVAPDVLTLDIEMPRMDGLTFLEKLMKQHPMPVVICSTLAAEGTASSLRALDLGAVDIIPKPKVGTKQFFEESKIRICDAIKAAARAKRGGRRRAPAAPMEVEEKLTADVILPKGKAMVETTERVVVVGASTGGTEALRELLQSFPEDAPGTVIVQHMPEKFTRAFADRLNGLCRVRVKEAEDGDSVLRGHVLIAPGNRHTLLKRSGARYLVEVRDGPLVCRHRPSVDVLFRSAARYAGKNAVAALLTGMGDDGARGMAELRDAGAHTMAQDKETCVVFGMPKEAIKRGGAVKVLPLQSIGAEILRTSKS
ncbi:MAG: chemotaxis response regulator protein-glutamate methylesterase [Myxococcales bacterium]|nr:chemotaxis response regulator protein-glutamate methylesterase [Myxococcales bacterium]